MKLLHLLVFTFLSALIALLPRRWNRTDLLLMLSVSAVFWLQTVSSIDNFGFWLPLATLGLAILAWISVTPPEKLSWRDNWKSAFVIIAVAIAWILLPYVKLPATFGVPAYVLSVRSMILLIILVLSMGVLSRLPRTILLWLLFFTTLLIFVVIKTPQLSISATPILRRIIGLSTEGITIPDIRWLGFSYVAFRIIHTVRDRQAGRMPPVLLGEYVTYVVFFPALSAGPIDRVERFVQDLRNPLGLCDEDWLYAVQRLLTGMFKKFVLADSLAYVALNAATATTVQPGLWTWTLLYAYSFQIFFDFSGYTDIAIGMARLVGVKLPENFNFPYLKSNLTQFWNNWHITLTQWFRGYFFNPLTRAFRSRQKSSPGMIIFIAQISTMLLIGLWHGVTLNFVLWGLWHGAGLFLHNRWSNFAGVHVRDWASTPSRKTLLDASGVLLTFNFVSIGWVFFSMPTLSLTWVVLSKLIG